MYGFPQAKINKIIGGDSGIIQGLQLTPPADLWTAILGTLLTAEHKAANYQAPKDFTEATSCCKHFQLHHQHGDEETFITFSPLTLLFLTGTQPFRSQTMKRGNKHYKMTLIPSTSSNSYSQRRRSTGASYTKNGTATRREHNNFRSKATCSTDTRPTSSQPSIRSRSE